MENNEKNQLFLYDFDHIGYSKKYFPHNNFEDIISKIIKRSEMLNLHSPIKHPSLRNNKIKKKINNHIKNNILINIK